LSEPGIPAVVLNNGVAMPQLGFGTWRVGQPEVEDALAAGYRSIDTASLYGNEEAIGRAIDASGVAREELFVTTKVWTDALGRDATLRSFDDSRRRLALDVVDLFLIHWPGPDPALYVESWRALEQLLAGGDVRAIGVSNFEIGDLERLARETEAVPAVNQVELNPHLGQPELRDYHAGRGIATEAWAPLARAGSLLREPAIAELAERYGKTPAQIVLRWGIELDVIVIPRSSNARRIAENLTIFDFRLEPSEVERISALDRAA
jgi:2,5-diketo-D-gluconate reductase A